MPTYDYKCLKCNHTFEYFQPMSAEPLKECPQCKGSLKRIIGIGAGPIFKGSGFYQTDYKTTSSANKGSSEADKKPSAAEIKPNKNEKKNG